MGWKAIKDHFQVKHIVQVTKKGICIGTGFVHDLITISKDGKTVTANRTFAGADGRFNNEELTRVFQAMQAQPELVQALVDQADTFARSITVYTFDQGEVFEKQCEELGYPNLTHDGDIMHSNRYSTDRDTVVQWAIADTNAALHYFRGQAEQLRLQLQEASEAVARLEQALARLHCGAQRELSTAPVDISVDRDLPAGSHLTVA